MIPKDNVFDRGKNLLKRMRSFARSRHLPTTEIRSMVGGYKIRLNPKYDSYEQNMYLKRTYEPATLALFDMVLRKSDIFLDVGANIGLMTVHAATVVGPSGRVVAVEAHPAYFKRLEENVEINNLDNVILLNCAAGAVEENRPIFDMPDVNIGRSSLVDPGNNGVVAGGVQVRRLDDLVSEAGVGQIRLCKMDVEGFEAEVLKGAPELLSSLPIICMEVVWDQPNEAGADPLAAHDIIMQT